MTATLPLLDRTVTLPAGSVLATSADVTELRAKQATLFQALSDPRRLEILERLRGGEQCVCNLQDACGGMGQSLLSFHLKTLRDAGLVASRREGRWMHYRITPDGLTAAHDAIAALRPHNTGRSAAPCCV
jgi:ArsR family transcriptional regulator